MTRPHAGRVIVCGAYLIATVGLMILAFDDVLYDRWAIFGASGATLVALVAILVTGNAYLWLGVGGAWIYAVVIEMIRGPEGAAKIGLSLVFLAFAFGALGAYVANRMSAGVIHV